MQNSSSRIDAAAKFLRNAASVPPANRAAGFDPDLQPQSVTEGYAVQDAQIGDRPIGAWKILATAAKENYSCAAIVAERVTHSGCARPSADEHMEIEVEIAIRIGRDLPVRAAPYTEADVSGALDTAHTAFEIVETRFARRKDVPPLSALADFQSNHSVVIGEGIADWRGLDLRDLDIDLTLNDVTVERKNGGATVEQVIAALTWLANHAVTRKSGGLRAGQFVITGARIGPSPMPASGCLKATIDKIGAVEMATAD